jgi:hypothetical protein
MRVRRRMLDGNRAYAAVLSGFTVVLVAIQQIDNPEHVLDAGMMRGAGILVGIASLTIVSDLLWAPTLRVEGYFEETKLSRIHVNDKATVRLIGESQLLSGHVESIAAGIEDRERCAGSTLLANVNPTFFLGPAGSSAFPYAPRSIQSMPV